METKSQIIERLVQEKKITLDEALVLLGASPEYIAQPYVYPSYPYPKWRFGVPNITDASHTYSGSGFIRTTTGSCTATNTLN
jgi:hypothetical protein